MDGLDNYTPWMHVHKLVEKFVTNQWLSPPISHAVGWEASDMDHPMHMQFLQMVILDKIGNQWEVGINSFETDFSLLPDFGPPVDFGVAHAGAMSSTLLIWPCGTITLLDELYNGSIFTVLCRVILLILQTSVSLQYVQWGIEALPSTPGWSVHQQLH